MCGRYSNHVRAMHDWAVLLGDWPQDVPLSHNVAPTQTIPVFTAAGGQGMRWGLIPPWSAEVSSKYATFNARGESVADKPSFKHAWFKDQRCLIPALGYYEWRTESGAKQPYFVHLQDSPMVFAGLFEPARSESIPASCTVLTMPSRGILEPLHSRMPVILPLDRARDWFAGSPAQADGILHQDHGLALQFYPVSKRVNNVRNDDEELIQPIAHGVGMLDSSALTRTDDDDHSSPN